MGCSDKMGDPRATADFRAKAFRDKMICIETQHFNINRMLLLIVGLWPYQRSMFTRLQIILLYSILSSFIVFQLTPLLTQKCTPDLIIKVTSSSIFFFIYLFKYTSFWINIQSIKYLLEKLQQFCDELKDENEIAIIEKYGYSNKRCTAVIAGCTLCSVISIILLPLWPHFVGMFVYINNTLPRHAMKIVTEYFIDQDKYVYLLLVHMDMSLFIGATVTVATGTILLGYLKHACGMFRIASYRLEQALRMNMQRNLSMEHEIAICKHIIYAVDIHRKAMLFSKLVITRFEISFFILIAFGVTCGSLNLFRVVSYEDDKGEVLLPITYVSVVIIYVLYANNGAQEVTDHSNDVFTTVYSVQWYIAPIQVQKMILFLLQRGTKIFTLNISGLFVASMESAATLMSASISYFTVLYSTR